MLERKQEKGRNRRQKSSTVERMMSHLKRSFSWMRLGFVAAIAIYAVLLTYPQPLFA